MGKLLHAPLSGHDHVGLWGPSGQVLITLILPNGVPGSVPGSGIRAEGMVNTPSMPKCAMPGLNREIYAKI